MMSGWANLGGHREVGVGWGWGGGGGGGVGDEVGMSVGEERMWPIALTRTRVRLVRAHPPFHILPYALHRGLARRPRRSRVGRAECVRVGVVWMGDVCVDEL